MVETMARCSDLESFRGLDEYAARLRNATSFNETLILQCQVSICNTLWGFGVPDLSGIGVTIGYLMSSFLSIFLSVLALARHANRFESRSQKAVTALATFFDCAVYFAFAVQVATIVTLGPKDFGTAKITFGDYEARIAGLVSVICLLPLLCPVALLPFINNREVKKRASYRLALFTFTVCVSLYPFYSRSILNFAETQIGEGKGEGGATYATDAEWAAVTRACFGPGGRVVLTERGHEIIRAFQLLASLSVVLFTVGALVPPGLRRLNDNYGRHPARDWIGEKVGGITRFVREENNRWLRYVLITVPTLLAAPLVWGFFRLRSLQCQLSSRTAGHYEANEWGFGQVMAITIFLPVVVEVIFVWRSRSHSEEEVEIEGVKQPAANEHDENIVERL
ncbi:hypothetical protein QBC42DRAFT_347186 [Cladorrhinum samala]|uniref:Uncharacterized protein n=1 Tax=Cladorrhinum samala TaxID=585594 RepID=A0AAV9HNB3_9PEZI|nr:hypothetical protein QBC42DRAFT_347186 [Cladorrhinum samala]